MSESISTAVPGTEAKPSSTIVETTSTTTHTPKVVGVDSQVAGVSVRAWIAVILIVTVCGMAFMGKEIKEPLYSSAMLALGFYFGQAKKP